MKTIINKRLFSFFILFSFTAFSQIGYGQDNRLIYPKQVSDAITKSNEILQRSDAYISVDFVEIDLETILLHEQLIVQFGENNFLINKERINVRGINNFCFVGKDSMFNKILLSILDGDIQGSISTLNGLYFVETFGDNDYAIIKIDQSKSKGCGGTEEDYDEEEELDGEEDEDILNIEYDSNSNWEKKDTLSFPILRSAVTHDCKIRVLVSYTPYAKTFSSNIKNRVLLAVALVNEAFISSDINYQIELAYAGLTNYEEGDNTISDFRKSLRRFRNKNDGYMDEIHTLREKYSADICVILLGNHSLWGLATGINVVKDRAFCAVHSSEACIADHSFDHEIGHLVGCRHDYYVDPNLVPHSYCHGYINPSMTWRTIMAYNNKCKKEGCNCPVIGYWSNPNVFYNGEPTGTSSLCNNARVWNEHSDNIMTFFQPDNNVIFLGNDYTNSSYGNVLAKQNITTSGTVNVNNGNSLFMNAGNSIKLLPGFNARAGSEFSAKIENIYDCGGSREDFPKIFIQSIQQEDEEMIESLEIDNHSVFDFSYKVYPNPSNEFINIQYLLETEASLSIELVNLLGQREKIILPQQNQQKGIYSFQIPISDFSTGTYFLTFKLPNQIKTEKIIINQ